MLGVYQFVMVPPMWSEQYGYDCAYYMCCVNQLVAEDCSGRKILVPGRYRLQKCHPKAQALLVAHQGALSPTPIPINLVTPTPRLIRVANYASYVMREVGSEVKPLGPGDLLDSPEVHSHLCKQA